MVINGMKISGITCNSKNVKQGYIFVAIDGQNFNGNDFIDEAIDRGAVIIYTEKTIVKKAVPIIKVENAREKLGDLLNCYYDYPSYKLYLIGVTGTNGKTTTTHMLERIFRKAGYKTGLIGTVGVKVNHDFLPPTLTTPEPEVLYDTLNNMVEKGVDVGIMEVSSHGLKFSRTHGLKFDLAIHTNIEKDHMNLHKSLEDYILTKKRLFDSLGENKIAIINIDDKHGVRLIEGNEKPLIITYGLKKKATLTASSLDIGGGLKFTDFTVCLQRSITGINGVEVEPLEFLVDFSLTGRHNVYNALAAIAAALSFNVKADIISQALHDMKSIHRRLERIYEGDYIVIDDYSHNPASYEAMFEFIQKVEYKNLIIVNAIRGNRGVEINKDNAEVFNAWHAILDVKEIILSLSQDTVGEKDKVRKDELLAFKNILDKDNIPYKIHNTLEGAISRALKQVGKGDMILLLGAQGMDKGREILYRFIVS